MTRKYVMKNPRPHKNCSICGSPSKGLGFCGKHYQNYKRLGTPFPNQNSENSIEDFLNKIDNIPLNQDGCKIWNRGKDKEGYGYYAIKGITYRSHRLLYVTLYPGDYEGLVIRHSCDTPACCNINHLLVGTPRDNTNDMISRGRHLSGSKIGTSKLSESQANEIREKYPDKTTIQLAEEYGVCKQTICNVINGITFINASHVNERYQPVNNPIRIEL